MVFQSLSNSPKKQESNSESGSNQKWSTQDQISSRSTQTGLSHFQTEKHTTTGTNSFLILLTQKFKISSSELLTTSSKKTQKLPSSSGTATAQSQTSTRTTRRTDKATCMLTTFVAYTTFANVFVPSTQPSQSCFAQEVVHVAIMAPFNTSPNSGAPTIPTQSNVATSNGASHKSSQPRQCAHTSQAGTRSHPSSSGQMLLQCASSVSISVSTISPKTNSTTSKAPFLTGNATKKSSSMVTNIVLSPHTRQKALTWPSATSQRTRRRPSCSHTTSPQDSNQRHSLSNSKDSIQPRSTRSQKST